MASSKPEFVVVPGAWHSPESFKPTTLLLQKAGYKVHGITLPSVGCSPVIEDFQPDVEVIRAQVNSLLASGKDVVMVYNSYGGSPGSEALADYVKLLEEGGHDQQKGLGKVLRLVYCNSFVLPEGGSLMGALQGKPLPWFDIENGIVRAMNPAAVFYNDLPPEEAAKHVAAIKPHSYSTMASKVTVAPWKTIPSTTIICGNDQALPAAAQEGMLAMAREMAPGSFDVVERGNAGHSPFISQPEWLTELLIKAAST